MEKNQDQIKIRKNITKTVSKNSLCGKWNEHHVEKRNFIRRLVTFSMIVYQEAIVSYSLLVLRRTFWNRLKILISP
jgi:hypothetical protein